MAGKIMKYTSKKLMNLSQIFEEPKILHAMIKSITASYVRDLFMIKKMTKIIPKTIIDIGGHFGESSMAMNYVFPHAKIYSFEPVQSSYKKLVQKTKKIPLITSYNFALGDKNGKFNFWLNNLSAASSLLDTKIKRSQIFEITKDKKRIMVNMKRFDKIKEIKIERPFYVKIDVEGAEKLVLEGFGNLIKAIDVLQIEYNFKDLYANQTKLKDIMKYIELAGLSSFIQLGNHVLEKDGIIYCDLIFFRTEDLKK